jgi:hypothetical protein
LYSTLSQSFNGPDFRVLWDCFKGETTGAYRLAIQMNCTSTALSNPTTKLGAGQADFIPKYPKQWGVGFKI